MATARTALTLSRYRRHAPGYDVSARRTMPLRRRVVDLLALQPGDSVLDVACGTGLSFPLIEEAIGPTGWLLGVELSPDMLDFARKRVALEGWNNVTLVEAAMEDADLPFAPDAILFNYAHDVLRSPQALEGIFRAARPGARVAAAGMKLFPWWLAPLNLYALAKARPYMARFEGLKRPWSLLESFVPGLNVCSTQFGMGYLARGTYAPSGASREERSWPARGG